MAQMNTDSLAEELNQTEQEIQSMQGKLDKIKLAGIHVYRISGRGEAICGDTASSPGQWVCVGCMAEHMHNL